MPVEPMNLLLVVNQGPWTSTRSGTALRLARAAPSAGLELRAVYFQGDGVYHALAGGHGDPGAEDLHRAWRELGAAQGAELLLCSAAVERRFPEPAAGSELAGFRVAGLGRLLDWIDRCDRVVTF